MTDATKRRLFAACLSFIAAGCATTPPTHYFGVDLQAPIVPVEAPMDARIASLEAKLQEATCALPEFSANRCGAYAIEYERLRSERRALLWADMTYAPLTSLARRAQTGDEAAQLELGIRFEEGRGVVRDLDNARRLYRLAATPSGGDMPIYVPGVGDAPGTVQWFNTGPRREGLAEARERLQALDARMEGETQ